ncbi:MAG: glycerol-3-phosphate 1-O-acyltransferase PlsY [Flavobacteriales bacterium]|nr:glycerol-3-phosphate 1-O-acyltransferase PlsY [Flavobacteriales bacterium]MCX7768418.1 glycerol-3-phosphate 1-O-acyltransferase PlsY [Flavobacteriales bacterium]MDW8409689.1 glycerol-3-phosphate 1-O-acyltransferase PlsY [Flavobacteriales bacterium]
MYSYMGAAIWMITAYLLGSLPWSIWIGQLFYGVDVRQHGSGNAGATNTFRVLGRRAGLVVLVLDIAKGMAAVKLGELFGWIFGKESMILLQELRPLAGACAILGHVYSVFLHFKGGKGVATALGVMASLAPWATLSSAGIFILAWLFSGYISVSSLSAALAFPLFHFLFYKEVSLIQWTLVVGCSLFIFYTHRSNIRRLLKGEESKMPLFKKVVKKPKEKIC